MSGGIGVGTSTLAFRLAQGKPGWEYINIGEWFRQYCREQGLPLEETGQQSDELHRQVDTKLQERLKREKGLVAEGWLTGFMAQGVAGVLKVLLVAPVGVRVKRFEEREKVSQEEAERHIQRRTEENLKKWQRLYGEVDFFDPDLYDVVIDTSRHDRQEVVKLVREKLDGR